MKGAVGAGASPLPMNFTAIGAVSGDSAASVSATRLISGAGRSAAGDGSQTSTPFAHHAARSEKSCGVPVASASTTALEPRICAG